MNIFDDFDFIALASQDFLEHHGLFTYEDALTQYENLYSIEASFAICWQQLDSLFFWMDTDELNTIWADAIKEIDSRGMWRGNYHWQFRYAVLKELWNRIDFESDEGYESDEYDSQGDHEDGHPDTPDYETIMEVFEEDARARRTSYRQRLSSSVRRANPITEPDEYISERDAIVYAHLSVGLALLLEETGEGQTERYWELLEGALRVIRTPQTEAIASWRDGNEFSSIVDKSMSTLEILVVCKLFHRDFDDRKYLLALERLDNACQMAVRQGEGLSIDGTYPTAENFDAFGWVQEGNDFPQINASDAGFHLIAHLIPPQKAVDVFETLWTENQNDTRWRNLSKHCLSFSSIWTLGQTEDIDGEPLISSKSFFEPLPPSTFWHHARALTLQRISPSELTEVLEQMRDQEAETRLRNYFFRDNWEHLPEKARKSLISADREYEHLHGRRPIIFDHLRSATRAIMVESLWEPYLEFLRIKASSGLKDLSDLQQVRRTIDGDSNEPDLRPLLKSPYFDEFLDTISEDTKFVKRLPGKLLDLNEWANRVSHEHHWGYKGFEGQIRDTYAEFLGIGRSGILPRLMRLHPGAETDSNGRT